MDRSLGIVSEQFLKARRTDYSECEFSVKIRQVWVCGDNGVDLLPNNEVIYVSRNGLAGLAADGVTARVINRGSHS